MSNFVRPHRQQPTRLPRPGDTPGKNTGVGCHFLLQCTKVKSESEVAQLCPTLDRDLEMGLQPRFRTFQGFWEQDLHSGALHGNVTQLCFHQVLGIKKLDYPGGPVVKSLPANAGDSGSIPSLGGFPHATLRATKPMHRNYWACALEPVLHNRSHCSCRTAPSCCN